MRKNNIIKLLSAFLFSSALATGLLINNNNTKSVNADNSIFASGFKNVRGVDQSKSGELLSEAFASRKTCTITANSTGTGANYSDTSCLVGGRYLTKIDEYCFKLTGTYKQGAYFDFVKTTDVETTVYVILENFNYFNNSWGPGIDFFRNKVLVNDGTYSTVNSTTPIHYVVALVGDNVGAGHNHPGFNFPENNIGTTESPNYVEATMEFVTFGHGTFSLVAGQTQLNRAPFTCTSYDEQIVVTNNSCQSAKIELYSSTTNLGNSSGYAFSSVTSKLSNKTLLEASNGTISGFYATLNKLDGVYKTSADIAKIILDANHTHVHYDEVAPDCTNPGTLSHYTCKDCGFVSNLVNNVYTPVSVNELTINPTGHDYGEATYVWSDDYSSCTATKICNNDSEHKIVETVYLNNEYSNVTLKDFETLLPNIIESGNATIVHIIVEQPTCTSYGLKTCIAIFGRNSLIDMHSTDVEIKPLGHDYGEAVYTWSDDNSMCTASRECSRCHDIETSSASITSEITQDPTCLEFGERTFTATFENDAFETQIKTEPILPLGHSYGQPIYTWSDDGTSCIAEVICETDRNHIVTCVGDVSCHIDAEPTCEGYGVYTYTAEFHSTEFEGFTTQTKIIDTISPIGHDYNDPVYTWDGFNSCHAEMVCKHDASHVIEANATITSAITTDPTCETTGIRTYTATFDNDAFVTQTKDEVLPAIGHDYGEPSYEWSDDYTSCTGTIVCDNDENHVVIVQATVTSEVERPATCEEVGTTKYTATFSDDRFSTQIVTANDIDPIGHDYNDPVYTWDGFNSCHAEMVCKHDASHVIEANATITSAITTDPTCETTGIRTYTATFDNDAFVTQTKDEILPAIGHDYGEPSYEWSDDYKSCTGTIVCNNDENHVVTVQATVTSEVARPATCEEVGTTKYTATFSDDRFSTQVVNVNDIEPIGHSYGTPTYVWSSDNSEVTATVICLNDTEHVVTETVATTSEDVLDPTCTEVGSRKFTATFTNVLFETQTKFVEIEELGHDVKEEWDFDAAGHWHACNHDCDLQDSYAKHTYTSTITKMPTTEEEGLRVYTCSVCGYSYEETIEKLPLPPNPEEMTEEEYEEQQKQYEEQQQQVIEQMTEVISDVIEVIEEPDPEAMSEEEYAREMERYEEKLEAAEQMASALEIINTVNSTDTSEEGSTISAEAKQQAQENVIQITEASSNEMNALAEEAAGLETQLNELLNDPEATEEEIAAVRAEIEEVQEKKDTAEIITTQAVVVTAKQTESEEMGSTINDSMPEGSDLNMGEVYNEFMQNQIDGLLGQQVVEKQKTRAVRREITSSGFDYSVSKDIYKKVGEFVDDSVGKMGTAALKIRYCTGEKTVASVKNYITAVKVSSFRDFDKEAADEEFALTCYDAILVQMQSEVLASLEANKPAGNNQAAMNQYKEEVAAVSDIEEFEIIVTEVLRQKYLALTGNDVDLDLFHDEIYWPIFRAWALNQEVPPEIFPDGNAITLEELTKATVSQTTKKGVDFKWEVNATKGDVIFIIIMASIAVVGIGVALIIPNLSKRKED